MHTLPLRLSPGQDLRLALEAAVAAQGGHAAFVLSGIGSLSRASLRFAGMPEATEVVGDLEVLTLSGTIASGASRLVSHLHASLSTADGQVIGGHVAPGCIVRTTAEVLLALLPEWQLTREADGQTGYDELVVRPRA